ncbi:MAG: hypothetical protein ABII64_05220 [Elusimicrobiota bacterium]
MTNKSHHIKTAEKRKAWVVSVVMGLGHVRAAYPLRDMAYEYIVIDEKSPYTSTEEAKLWKRIKNTYYFMAKAEAIPVVGRILSNSMLAIQSIQPYYPMRDLSNPTWGSKYLNSLIKDRRLCSAVVKTVESKNIPMINTFYATAIAADMNERIKENYLVICDADINRVWVPEKPSESQIKYLAPCSQVKRRLMLYGVPEENIHLTGFPLPKENIGDKKKLEILKDDLFKRLLRLDPNDRFFKFHSKSSLNMLGKDSVPREREDCFTLTFAVGGAGVHSEIAYKILKSLKVKIIDGRIRLNLSAGTRQETAKTFLGYIDSLKLSGYLGTGIKIIHDNDINKYFEKFNFVLRETDVLWTKPSELSFYCALGIPIVFAPSVGSHENLNRDWLMSVHAGIIPPGPVEFTDQWLFDLRESGRLAEAAWDGFLKARKLGTYKIEEIIQTGHMTSGDSPFEF